MDHLLFPLTITLSPAPCGVVMFASLIAAATDVLTYKVFNWLTIPLLASGLVYHALVPAAEGFWFSLSGATLGLLILLPIYVVGGMGAGDVKLLTGIGAWLGTRDFLSVFLLTALLSGLFSLVLLLVNGTLKERLGNLVSRPSQRERVEDLDGEYLAGKRQRFVPFASMTALAVLLLVGSHALRASRVAGVLEQVDEVASTATTSSILVSGCHHLAENTTC